MAVVRYTYDAWGAPTGTTSTMAATLGVLNPFRYRSYVFDEETGLYYIRERYYNAKWCRFCNSDSELIIKQKGGLCHQFSYCSNDPIGKKDPDGREEVVAYDEEDYNPTNDMVGKPSGSDNPHAPSKSVTIANREIRITPQKMYQLGKHFNKHGREVGTTSKTDYQNAAYRFGLDNLDNPHARIDIGYQNTRNGMRGNVQVALMHAGKTLILDLASGQMIDFYVGAVNSGIIHQQRIR